ADAGAGEDGTGEAGLLFEQGQEQVFGVELLLAVARSEPLGGEQGLLGFLGETVDVHPSPPPGPSVGGSGRYAWKCANLLRVVDAIAMPNAACGTLTPQGEERDRFPATLDQAGVRRGRYQWAGTAGEWMFRGGTRGKMAGECPSYLRAVA